MVRDARARFSTPWPQHVRWKRLILRWPINIDGKCARRFTSAWRRAASTQRLEDLVAQPADGLLDAVYRNNLHVFNMLLWLIKVRYHDGIEAQLRRLANALLAALNRPHLARKSNFTENQSFHRQRLVFH